jgi:hypothetical protein
MTHLTGIIQETHPPQQDQFTVEPNNTPSPRSQNPVARRMLDDQGEYLPITGTSSPEFSELYEICELLRTIIVDSNAFP